MIRLLLLALVATALPARAGEVRTAKLRALCFEAVDGLSDVLYVGPDGKSTTPLKLWTTSFSDEIEIRMDGGAVRFAVPDKAPDGTEILRIVAEGQAVEGARQLALFIPQQGKIPYRLVMMDDSEKGFPMGSIAAMNLAPTPVRLRIGERDVQLKPGARGSIPQPAKVNDRNQANVEISFLDTKGAWVPVNNTRWLISPLKRSIAIAFLDRKTNQPTVNSYDDTPPWRLPKLP